MHAPKQSLSRPPVAGHECCIPLAAGKTFIRMHPSYCKAQDHEKTGRERRRRTAPPAVHGRRRRRHSSGAGSPLPSLPAPSRSSQLAMVLCLALHATAGPPSATVPFNVILLQVGCPGVVVESWIAPGMLQCGRWGAGGGLARGLAARQLPAHCCRAPRAQRSRTVNGIASLPPPAPTPESQNPLPPPACRRCRRPTPPPRARRRQQQLTL